MVPAAVVDSTLDELEPLMAEDDIIIDGGNSYYRDDLARAERLKANGIHYVDVGTSGGVFGLERGFCLMIGGEDASSPTSTRSSRPSRPAWTRRRAHPGARAPRDTAENGYLHCGPNGAGHFVKMVHNGIEYGIMAAYAEGLNVLHNANAGKVQRTEDAETDAAARARVLPVRPRHPRGHRGVATGQRDRVVAPRPHRRRAQRVPRPRRLRRPGFRLR